MFLLGANSFVTVTLAMAIIVVYSKVIYQSPSASNQDKASSMHLSRKP